jgi:hypothetical protein
VRAHRIYTRRTEARKLREEAAELAFLRPYRDHISSAEEAEYRRPNGQLSYIAKIAFIAWGMLQTTSSFDVSVLTVLKGAVVVIAGAISVVFGVLASRLAAKAVAQPPPPEPA